VSIKLVADAIVKAVGFEGEYKVSKCLLLYVTTTSLLTDTTETQFDTSRADGQFRKPASNKKLLELTGGFQFTPFDLGKRRSLYRCCLSLLMMNGF
jgi:GDP-L-fucose synthase